MVKFVALSSALAAYRCQPMHLSVLVDGCGDPLGIRVSSESFMGWTMGIASKNLYVGSSPALW